MIYEKDQAAIAFAGDKMVRVDNNTKRKAISINPAITAAWLKKHCRPSTKEEFLRYVDDVQDAFFGLMELLEITVIEKEGDNA